MDASGTPSDGTSSQPRDAVQEARRAFRRAAKLLEASIALLRAELRLARSSVVLLAGLAIALLFLGLGAWLGINAAIAAGVYELTDNIFYGVATAALVNIAGMMIVVFAMRRCAKDVTMPRTRRMLGRFAKDPDGNA